MITNRRGFIAGILGLLAGRKLFAKTDIAQVVETLKHGYMTYGQSARRAKLMELIGATVDRGPWIYYDTIHIKANRRRTNSKRSAANIRSKRWKREHRRRAA